MKNKYDIIKKMEMQFELSKAEVRKLADICLVVGEVFFGSVVIPFLFGSLKPLLLIIGLVATCGAWVGSVYLVRKSNALL